MGWREDSQACLIALLFFVVLIGLFFLLREIINLNKHGESFLIAGLYILLSIVAYFISLRHRTR